MHALEPQISSIGNGSFISAISGATMLTILLSTMAQANTNDICLESKV